jgi:mannose/cellobiose epimerase-like protein (N-acyl-D-glucosamine 2-epimerase family)
MTLEELREEYRRRLFDQYLPFWDRGGYDEERGGFICNLNDDGSAVDDEKALWFQARAVFIYSLLYNELGQNPRHLEIAQKTRDFIVRYMNAGGGNWYQRTRSDGTVTGGIHDDATGEWFYGMMYVVEGLAELYRATGNTKDMDIVRETLQAALKAYDDPEYTGAWNYGGYPDNLSLIGFRVQSHSMAFIGILTRLLSHIDDNALEQLQKEHVDLVMNIFYNPELGITNENLHHDFSRIEGHEDYMQPGHSVETLWLVMFEAIRTKKAPLFEEAASRFRRYLELGWDFAFEGFGDMHYWVYDSPVRAGEKM